MFGETSPLGGGRAGRYHGRAAEGPLPSSRSFRIGVSSRSQKAIQRRGQKTASGHGQSSTAGSQTKEPDRLGGQREAERGRSVAAGDDLAVVYPCGRVCEVRRGLQLIGHVGGAKPRYAAGRTPARQGEPIPMSGFTRNETEIGERWLTNNRYLLGRVGRGWHGLNEHTVEAK